MKVIFSVLFAIASMCAVPVCAAQSSSPIELYGPVLATQVYDSLGTNTAPTHEWEYQAAQAAHITWGRFDCSWQAVEIQNLPQNTSGGYSLPKSCAQGIALGKTYGVRTMTDALYGAPYGEVATGVTTVDVGSGATSIPLRITSGSLAYVHPGQSYIKIGSQNISAKHAYAGTLIVSVSGNSVALASALTTNIAAGSQVVLNLQLYAPVRIAPGTDYLSNPSVRAYESYVHFLQTQIASSGMPGRVSIWNEPPWSGDPWDNAGNLYDHPPAEDSSKFGVELAYAALTLPVVPGVPLDNGFTNKSGSGSVLHPGRLLRLPQTGPPSRIFASESFHPYGNNPEDDAWDPACVQTHNTPAMLRNVYKDCTPIGANVGGNVKWEAAFSAAHDGILGLTLGITETGIGRKATPPASETQISRFDLRQFLIFSGLGVHPILFYRLAGDAQLEWMNAVDHSPYPVYTAFQNLMADMQTIAHPPVAPYSAASVPTVASYAGTYPLATVALVGSRAGDRANSLILYAWQRSYSNGKWVSLPSPNPANLSVSIPPGLRVAVVKDTVTSSPIPCRENQATLSFPVSDNPIEVMLTPVASSSSRQGCEGTYR